MIQFPFSISDPKSPYYMILIKSLDMITTWMFLSQGFNEGNPLAREGIRLYGFTPMASFAIGITFLYTLALHILWNKAETRALKIATNFTFNLGLFVNIMVPFWNWYMMSHTHFLS